MLAEKIKKKIVKTNAIYWHLRVKFKKGKKEKARTFAACSLNISREFNRANHTRSLIDSNQCSSIICWVRSKLSSVDRNS